jgi:hypothetical protein
MRDGLVHPARTLRLLCTLSSSTRSMSTTSTSLGRFLPDRPERDGAEVERMTSLSESSIVMVSDWGCLLVLVEALLPPAIDPLLLSEAFSLPLDLLLFDEGAKGWADLHWRGGDGAGGRA